MILAFVIPFLTSNTVDSRLRHTRFVDPMLRLSTGRYFSVVLVLISLMSCLNQNLLTMVIAYLYTSIIFITNLFEK